MAWRRPKSTPTTPRAPEPAAVAAEEARALTAAVATVELGPGSAWQSWKFANREWQIEAWRLYDIIPELRFLAGWIGDSVSQARLYVTEINENGEETGEVKDAAIARLAAVPLGTGSQRDDNLRLMGIDLAIGGEAWVVGEGALTEDPQGWFVLSGAQIMRTGDDINVRRPMATGGGILTLQDGADVLIRAWRPHPNDIAQSDSPTRSAIPPLREIELLTKREFAELESRLTGPGVWPVPEGWDFPRGEGDPEGASGYMAFLQRTMAENIRDQSQASAVTPIMFTIPDHLVEHLDKVKPINFWSELSDQIPILKEKAIIRVAASFEIPSELLTGLGDANHWSAWAVSEEGIKRCKPYLATIADTLTRGFLIPALINAGVENPERYAYAFDVSPLAVRPNQHDQALALSDRFLIRDSVAVTSSAFSEEQMPTEEEKLKMLIFRSVAKDPTLLADPAIQAAIGLVGPAPISAPAPRPPAELPAAPDVQDDEDNAPPEQPSDPGARPTDAPTQSRVVTLTGSAQDARFVTCKLMTLRALELAGGRLATHTQRRGALAGIPRHELHTRLGPIPAARAEKALEGAWDHVYTVAADLQVDAAVMRSALHGHALELLARGLGYEDADLVPVIARMGWAR